MNRTVTAQMERTPVKRVMTPEDATELVGTDVGERVPNVTSSTVFTDAETGETLLAYLPLGDVADLRQAVRQVDIRETYRAASGRRNASRVFGWAPRRPVQRREACNATSFAKEQPGEQATLDAYAVYLMDLLRGIDPTIADRDEESMREVLPEWRMAGTTWTSGVVNQNSQLPYHRDGFNFPTWSAMPVIRRACDGGHLHLPEYDLTVACRDGWAVFFCGHALVHGVTPMRLTKPDGYRFSVVYYALRGMKDCHTFAEETRLAQIRRTGREQNMAAGGGIAISVEAARGSLRHALASIAPEARVKAQLKWGKIRLFVVAAVRPPDLPEEWEGLPVEWVEGEGKDGADAPQAVYTAPPRAVTTSAATVIPSEAEVAAQGPDDPALMPQ